MCKAGFNKNVAVLMGMLDIHTTVSTSSIKKPVKAGRGPNIRV